MCESNKNPLIVVLDNLRSAHNVGSVFRCCDAFGVDLLLLCGITATPPHKGIAKTALGATKHVRWRYFADTMAAVKSLNVERCVAVENGVGEPLSDLNVSKSSALALVLGNEVDGVDAEVLGFCTEKVHIPQVGKKECINVAVAAGVVLWKVAEQRLFSQNMHS